MKGNLLLGTGRGKLGDVVARVLHGEQVFSKYQPVVFNPKSIAQTRQREMLSIATKKATVLNDLKAKGADLYYSNKFGASRNIRNLIVSLSVRAQRLADMDNLGNLIMPVIPEVSSIGNSLEFISNTFEGYFIQPTADSFQDGSHVYFGSDIPLDSSTKIAGFTTLDTDVYGDCSKISIFEMDVDLTSVPVDSACLSLPKTPGAFVGIPVSNVPSITGYPFIYSFPVASWSQETMQGGGLKFSAKNFYAFISWRDSKGNIISTKSTTKSI